jgi:hypothetical protein
VGTLSWILLFVASLSGELASHVFFGYWYPFLTRLLYVVFVVQGGTGVLGNTIGILCIAIGAFMGDLSYIGSLVYFVLVALLWRSGRAAISPSLVVRGAFVALFLLGGWLVELYGPFKQVLPETIF